MEFIGIVGQRTEGGWRPESTAVQRIRQWTPQAQQTEREGDRGTQRGRGHRERHTARQTYRKTDTKALTLHLLIFLFQWTAVNNISLLSESFLYYFTNYCSLCIVIVATDLHLL